MKIVKNLIKVIIISGYTVALPFNHLLVTSNADEKNNTKNYKILTKFPNFI